MQALLPKKLARHIPYIHSYNHQLHLVVVHAKQEESCAKRFFDLSGSLYNFYHHHCVSEKYDAPCLRRLLEIRWTSHYDVTKCIVENKDRLLTILSGISEDDNTTVDLSTGALGLIMQIKRRNLFEIGKFLVNVLGVLKPANAEDELHPPKRIRTLSQQLCESVVLSPVGHTDSDEPSEKIPAQHP